MQVKSKNKTTPLVKPTFELGKVRGIGRKTITFVKPNMSKILHINVLNTLFVILVSTVSLTAFSQDPYVIEIKRERGLKSDVVYDVVEDSQGFFWIATSDGLVRYDGHQMVSIEVESGRNKAGSFLMLDQQGRLWFENFDGNLYYKENGMLRKQSKGLPIGFFNYAIIENKLMHLKRDSMVVFDTKTLRQELALPFKGSEVFYVLEDKNGVHVFSADHQFISVNGEVSKRPMPSEIKQQTPILGVLADEHFYFISKNNRAQAFYRTDFNSTVKVFDTPELSFIQNVFFIDEKFWFCCSDGLFIYTKEGKLINDGPYFKGRSISAVKKDSRENYWICTLTDGVFVVKNFNRTLIETSPYKLNKLLSFGDKLIAGTKNGKLIDFTEGSFGLPFFESRGNHSIYFLESNLEKSHLYSTSSSFDIFNDKLNRYFTHEGAIKDVDWIDGKYLAFAGSGASGLLLLNDLNVKSDWDSMFTAYNNREQNEACAFIEGRGKSVAYKRDKEKLYYSTNQGFFEITKKGTRRIQLEKYNDGFQKIDFVGDILLALSVDGEILFYGFSGDELVPIESLIPGRWRSFKVDEKFIYLLGDERLSYIRINDKSFRINELKGLNHNEKFNDIVHHNRFFYVANEEGVIQIPEQDFSPNYASRLFIDEIRIEGISSKELDLSLLEYDQNNISVEFSVASYPGEIDQLVYYSLDKEKWNALNAGARSLKLPSLSSGFYTIYLKVGEEGEVVSSPSFIIRKAFWESYGFIFSIVLFLGVGVFFYYRYQTGLLKRQNKLLLEKISLEKDLQLAMMRSIKSQMNPHFFYNALNTIQSFIFNDDKRNAGIYLSKFSQLTRRILELSEREYVLISEEVQTIQLYLEIEIVRFNGELEFEINVSEDIDQDMIRLPGMLIQPYVENAIKHGLLHKKGAKRLYINFYRVNEFLKIDIIDNGIGRERSRELNAIKNRGHQSFATHANSKRLELLNKAHGTVGVEFIDRKDETGAALGTTVKITVPINT